MTVAAFFFYLFSAVMLASAFLVVTARNPVHSVLFLILAFVNAAGLFILLGAEFLAMILIVVYVGAVAVLFLFVVMMLDVDFAELKEGFLRYLPVGALVVGSWSLGGLAISQVPTPTPPGLSNTAALGSVLYTQYVYLFEAAGFVLMTAMIGAIVLTLHHKEGGRRQSVEAQNARTAKTAVELKKGPSRAGV